MRFYAVLIISNPELELCSGVEAYRCSAGIRNLQQCSPHPTGALPHSKAPFKSVFKGTEKGRDGKSRKRGWSEFSSPSIPLCRREWGTQGSAACPGGNQGLFSWSSQPGCP